DEYWEASKSLLKGIELLQEGLEKSPDDENNMIELASGYQLLGLSYEKLARYTEALEFQQKGLDLAVQLNRPTQTAQGFQYLANLYWATGDYRRALFNQAKALEEFESSGDVVRLVMAYSTQGLIYYGLGELNQAKQAEEKALVLAENTERLADQATILKNMGMIFIQEKDFDQAYDAFFSASHIDSSLGFRRGLAYDYWNLGNLLVHQGQIEQSIPLLKRGLNISREIEDKRNEVQSLYGLGKAYHLFGNQKTALAILDSGVVAASGLMIPERLWRLYRQRAIVLETMGQDEKALIDFQRAIEIVEGLRAELKIDALQQGFLDDKMDLYVDVINHLVKMNRMREAFHFVERAKSRSFIDLLGNQRLNLIQAQDALLGREQEARLAVQEAQDRVSSFVLRGRSLSELEQEEMKQWDAELDKRRGAYEAILVSIQTESPELASFVSVDPWSLEQIQNILPDSSALVEYYLTDKLSFCWVVLKDKLSLIQMDVREEVIRESVIQFRETIQANLSTELEGQKLYSWLVEPFINVLGDVKHIIFIPHGILHYLPFAAMQNKEGKYLIDRFSISYAPSATVFGYCVEKEEQNRYQEKIKSVLALSNPDLGSSLYDLPFAEKEAISLQRVYDDVSIFSGSEVTERVVRDQIGSYQIIHFACHGTFEPKTPLFSALLLSPTEEDDGRLEVHEIFSLNLNCDLITLSACETGLGEITQGDEIIGLSRSFIFAGAPSIVTSLWKVDDLATAVMVKRFYRYYSSGYTKAEALRMAQLVVKESVNGHPAAWAAFGLTGTFQ
ncbi:CHAT domain-containing tetratricopeptide repeat protein, partial [bacterium]|nr:CHAT domain-containing tetratricopeptide repeat protein [bacterium]